VVIQRFVLALAVVAAANSLGAWEAAFAGEAIRQPAVQKKFDKPLVPPENEAPLINTDTRSAIPDQYIVLFKRDAGVHDVEALEAQVKELGGTVLFSYRTGVLGFAARFGEDVLAIVRANPHVQWVEADQKMRASSVTEPALSQGIDRIDRRRLPLNTTFQYTETGQGVHVYVLDSGIRITHKEFGNRASDDFTAISDCNGKGDCGEGHGTHVAGTVGGKTYGVAKNVRLHSVRVMDCNGHGEESAVIAGVHWITAYSLRPAVANMSISGDNPLPSLDNAVQESIASGVTYVVAAHNSARDACNYSPARVPEAITVGAVNPSSDVRWAMSNDGPCVDLFAPGVAILSAGIAHDTATKMKSGTSMAAAHVAGVAALYLQSNPRAKPADVWNEIHRNNNVSSTPNWDGVRNPGITSSTASPNELLHWGALNDGYDDGDPHITTVDGAHYDFQSAGEFVLLSGGGVEIQMRQTPVATTVPPGPDPYDRLATCVSLNTAVAARVGSHRVTYQPNLNGLPDPSGMQLRIDGNLAPLNAQGINLAGGGRVGKTAIGTGLEIRFPDDTVLTAVPGWWAAQGKWFLNVHVNRTRATDGIMGAIAQGSWLPALPNGKSMGPAPPSRHQRFVDLYQTFADAWRVTEPASLFDYAPGTSTNTFTIPGWPSAEQGCTLAGEMPAAPAELAVAREACSGLLGKNARADCVFDAIVTGEREFAKTYLLSQQLRFGATSIVVTADRDSSAQGNKVTFTANVSLLTPRTSANSRSVIPTGTVQFFLNGDKAGQPVRLDTNGRATWTTSRLLPKTHEISARYSPRANSAFLMSSSADRAHTIMDSE